MHSHIATLQTAFPSLARFFRWWFAELGGLIPQPLRQALTSQRPLLLLDIDRDWVSVCLQSGEQQKALGEFHLARSTRDDLRRTLHVILSGQVPKKSVVILRLPSSQTLRWRLTLPSAAEAELRQALAYQIRQRTLFQPEETYFDYHVAERWAEGAQLTIDVAVAPRPYVDQLLAQIETLGLKPERLDVATENADFTPRFNLLPRSTVSGQSKIAARMNALLALLASALLLVNATLPLEQRRAHRADLQARLADARIAAEQTLRLQTDVERLSSESSFLVARKKQLPTHVQALDELTALLPDHTSLTELKINGRQVHIVGTSAAASALVGLIDESPLFRIPRFRSPVTRDPRDGLERFNLVFEIEETQEVRQ